MTHQTVPARNFWSRVHVTVVSALLLFPSAPSSAQDLPWWELILRDRHPSYPSDQRERSQALPDLIQDGGARPEIGPKAPAVVSFDHDFPANSIIIDTGGRKLYYVLGQNRAFAYDVSVGREGFNWSGTETISRKQAWPDWHPPAEMRERDASLPEKMTGGLRNPLGATALYLGNTLYRIHGTNDVKSIGRAQSSGCFRMLNSAVLHLASIAEIGTAVTVVEALPKPQQISRASETSTAPRDEPRGGPALNPAMTVRPRAAAPDYQALRDQTLGRR